MGLDAVVLIDTSVWVDHLRAGDRTLAALLHDGVALVHPFVIGELACGNLRNRNEILGLLGDLPSAPMASEREALHLIQERALMGRGIGYLDVHLLAAVMLAAGSRLWTRDRRLHAVASDLAIAFAAA